MREWLRVRRKELNISQKVVSEKAGISQNYYSAIEAEKRGQKLPVKTAKAIAKVLGFNWMKFYDEQ